MDNSDPPKTRLRWYQFSVRTLLLLMAFNAIVMWLYLDYVDSYKRQHEAALALSAKGVKFKWRSVKPAWLKAALGVLVEKGMLRDCITVRAEHCSLNDEDLEYLRHMPHIEQLYLARNPIGGEGLEHVKGLKHLKRLSLWGTKLTDAGLRPLAACAALEVLDIHDVESNRLVGTGRWFPDLWQEHSFVHLRSGKNDLSGKCLEHLAGLKNLKAVYFSFPVDDEDLAVLANLPNVRIRMLILDGVTDAGLPNLPKLRALEAVLVMPSQFGDDGFRQFSRIKHLRRLWLENVQIAENGWWHLSGMTNLIELSLHHCRSLRDADLPYLGKLTGVEKLSLRSTKITDDGIGHLTGLENLQQLDLRDTPLTADCLEHLVGLNQLECLWFQSPLDDDAVRWLAKLPQLKQLRGVDRHPHYELYLTDAGLAELPKVACLQSVTLCDARDGLALDGVDVPLESDTMTDTGMARLWEGHGFRWVNVRGRDVTLGSFRWGPEFAECWFVEFFSPRAAAEIIYKPLGDGIEHAEIRTNSLVIRSNRDVGPGSVEVRFADSGDHLDLLRYMSNIKRLTVSCLVRDWGNLRFVPGLEEFESGEWASSPNLVDSVGIRWLGEMNDLRSVACGIPDDLSPEGLAPLGRLRRLEELKLHCGRELYRGKYAAESLRFVAELKNLRKLSICGRPRSADDERWLQCIANLPLLEELSLSEISDVGTRLIGQGKSLVRLSFSGSVTDEGFKHLDNLSTLKFLNIHGTEITDERLADFNDRHPEIHLRTWRSAKRRRAN